MAVRFSSRQRRVGERVAEVGVLLQPLGEGEELVVDALQRPLALGHRERASA